jgi:tetratricopeptide (TPR) repeat protein
MQLVAAPAFADKQPAENEEAQQEAVEHYERGLQHYNLREYDKAIAELKESYRLAAAPQLLFNIAQAHRLNGDLTEALGFYRTYLRELPNAPNVGVVRDLITELERKIEEEAARKRDAEPLTGGANEPVTGPVDSGPRPTGRGKKIAGAITAGFGVASVGLATVFGVRARSAASDVSDVSDAGGSWSPELEALYSRGERDEGLAIVLGVAGATAVVTGAVLYYLGHRDARNASVSASVTTDSAGVAWTVRF